jgi:outer membrane immunogenic protein
MRRLGPAFLALFVAAGIATAPAASAADLPAAPAYYPPQSYHPALYDWTGFYLGAHVGLGLLLDSATQQSALVTTTGIETSLNPFGLVGGVQFGVNYQFAPWVVGLEGTFSSSDISGSGNTPALNIAGTTDRFTAAAKWYGSAAVRFGYAADTVLLYLKGGGAWMRAAYTQDFLNANGFATSTFVVPDTRMGFVVGLGAEYGMTDNLSAKFEYDFFDFGSRTYTFNLTNPVSGAAIAVPVSEQSYTHMFTVGLNYRFTWGGGHAPY